MPTCSLDSIRRCAAAASASGNVLIDDRLDDAGFEQRPDLARERGGDLRPSPRPVRGRSVEPVIVNRRPSTRRRSTLARLAAHEADLHEPPVHRQRGEIRGHIAAAHDVEDQIDAAARRSARVIDLDEILRCGS